MSDEKPEIVVDTKLIVTLEIDGATGMMDMKVNKEGVPSMAIRSYFLTMADKLFMNEIMAQSENRFMARIGGKRKKGIIQ